MKKWLNYILIFMFIFIGMDGVEAKMTTCKYSNYIGGVQINYNCSISSTKKTIECNLRTSDSLSVSSVNLDNDLDVDDFLSNDEVTCLDKIYIETTTNTTTQDTSVGPITSVLVSVYKIDNHEFDIDEGFMEGVLEFTGTYSHEVVQFPLDGDPIIGLEDGEDFGEETDEDYLDSCDELGETGQLIKKIYNLFKYLIPVLVVGLSIIDFLKVLLNGEEKVFNEAWTKFIKRIIIGIIILIIPFIISLLLNISGVLDNYGIDNNMKSIFCIFE